MPRRLNLAALTDDELQQLVGQDRAVTLLPDLSLARLEGRTVPGAAVADHLAPQALDERAWGATPEQARAISALHQDLLAAGAQALGTYYLPGVSEVRHLRAYRIEPDCSAGLRWSETPETAGSGWPFVQLLTWLRDRASGSACVLTSNTRQPYAPSLSEEIDVHLHPDCPLPDLLSAHRGHVLRHGRAQKLPADGDWTRPWQAMHALNLTAWDRRNLIIPG
ncbi:hypothetical protein [Deinococcus radiotolerans]|uniref:hypothetical protein n=1 Tax=Deinococcus radiotolerans TaxID=1309407 RepID=UPI001E43160B|nr:hypothetical protein [Deinococcus radiotolerans]